MEVRSRLVAREIHQKGTDSCFAGTPPLALVRYVSSRAATLSKTGKRRQLMVLDAERGFLHADARCSSRMATPCSETWCRHWLALLKQLSMRVWTLISSFWTWSCTVTISSSLVVIDDLDWLSQKLNEKLELVQKARLGPGHDSEATVLNRCVVFNDSGLTWRVFLGKSVFFLTVFLFEDG